MQYSGPCCWGVIIHQHTAVLLFDTICVCVVCVLHVQVLEKVTEIFAPQMQQQGVQQK